MPEKLGGPEEPKNPQKRVGKVERVITLTNREEMLARLVKVNDSLNLQEKFYPILLNSAGKKQVPRDIFFTLAFAILEYTKGMPPLMAKLLYMQAPGFIDALVTDPEDAQEAKALLQEVLGGNK